MLVDLGSFYLPPTCRIRIVFKTSVLVGYTVFRVNMSDEMPRSALSTPLIGKQPWGHQTPIFHDSCHRSDVAFRIRGGRAPDTVAKYTSSGSFPQESSSRSAWPSWLSAYLSPSCWSDSSMMSGAMGRRGPSCAFEGTLMLMGLEWIPEPSLLGYQVCEKPRGPPPVLPDHSPHRFPLVEHQAMRPAVRKI